MKRLALAAAAGAAVVGLTSCSHPAGPSAAPATHHTPISCSQQYRIWTHGEGKGVMGALDTVASATVGGDSHALKATLKQARPTVTRAAEQPIPACADPRGYWNVLLMHLSAAVADKGSSSSVRAALRDMPKIHHQLLAEIEQTAR